MADKLTDRPTLRPDHETPQGIVPAATPPVDVEEAEEEGTMTLREHLLELRDRLVRACLGVAAGTIIGFFIAGPTLTYFQGTVCPGNAPDCRWQVIDPTEPLVTFFKVALYIGVALSLPVVLYQIIRFVVPGLTRSEKVMLFIALPFISILFVVGATFALLVVLPAMIRFLGGFGEQFFRVDFRASEMLSLTMGVTMWMGLIFQMPLIMVVLTRLGLVTWRKLLSWWRYALIIIMVLAAIVTPTPDPVNMMIVAGPMFLLYALGVILARLFATRAVVQEAAAGD
jgi:sec-independent protein translocase protein TatC